MLFLTLFLKLISHSTFLLSLGRNTPFWTPSYKSAYSLNLSVSLSFVIAFLFHLKTESYSIWESMDFQSYELYNVYKFYSVP